MHALILCCWPRASLCIHIRPIMITTAISMYIGLSLLCQHSYITLSINIGNKFCENNAGVIGCLQI